MMSKPIPSAERVRALFNYNAESGLLSWRHPRNGRSSKAGWNDGRGYLKVNIDGFIYYGHHVIWLWMTGKWPLMIDHKDMDKANYRWSNLRECTKTLNQGNLVRRPKNSSGYKGIGWDAERSKWRVQIGFAGARYMKRTRTLAGAIALHRLKSSEFFGEFARNA